MEQNDCRFQIETNPTKELMKEAYGAVMWHSWRAWVYVALALAAFGLSGYFIYDAYLWTSRGFADAWRDHLVYIVYGLLLAAYLLVRLFTAPGLSARRYMKRMTAVFGDAATLSVSYRFAEDALHTQDSTGQRIDTAYDQFVSVRETANCIVLRRKMSMFHTLDKSRLEGGSLADFRAFLQDKMTNAKFHWKMDE